MVINLVEVSLFVMLLTVLEESCNSLGIHLFTLLQSVRQEDLCHSEVCMLKIKSQSGISIKSGSRAYMEPAQINLVSISDFKGLWNF